MHHHRMSVDLLRVARAAGLVRFCDALAFYGLDEEQPALCAAGLAVFVPTGPLTVEPIVRLRAIGERIVDSIRKEMCSFGY